MRRETHRNGILADVVSNAVHHLEELSGAVSHRAASLVAAILQELIEKEAAGARNFDRVDPASRALRAAWRKSATMAGSSLISSTRGVS